MIRQLNPPIILFDMDGVLVESKGHEFAAMKVMQNPRYRWNYARMKRDGIKPMSILRLFEAGDSDSKRESFRKLNRLFRPYLPKPIQRWIAFGAIAKRVRKYEYLYSDFYPNALETVKTLHQQGIIMGICTNAEGHRTEVWLRRKRIEHIFPCYMSRDYIKQYGIKPSARPLYALLGMIKKHYHLGPIDLTRVAFVGDNRTDIMSAKHARMKSIAVLCGHGYYNEIAALQPDLMLQTVGEIPQHLAKLFPS